MRISLGVALCSCFVVPAPIAIASSYSAATAAAADMLDANNAVVVTGGRRAAAADAAAVARSRAQLIEGVQRRSSQPEWGLGQPQQDQHPQPPSPSVVAIHLELTDAIGSQRATRSPGSFSVAVSASGGTDTITIAATDAAGIHAGIGRLQRELRIDPGSVSLPRNFSCVVDAADAF